MLKLSKPCIGLLIVLVLVIQFAQAAVIYVPDDYPTIQQAVNAASPSDTIIVRMEPTLKM